MISDEDLKLSIINRGELMTQKMLEVLSGRQPYYKVITSELGQLLLKKHIDELKEVYGKIFNGDHNQETLIYATALQKVLDFWCKLIMSQDELINKIKGDI